jgi:hypothetical protein
MSEPTEFAQMRPRDRAAAIRYGQDFSEVQPNMFQLTPPTAKALLGVIESKVGPRSHENTDADIPTEVVARFFQESLGLNELPSAKTCYKLLGAAAGSSLECEREHMGINIQALDALAQSPKRAHANAR